MRRYLFVLLGLMLWSGLRANAQAFDLTGPKVDVHVKRGDVTLPIGEVPNLQVNDRLWIHPDFPADQAVHSPKDVQARVEALAKTEFPKTNYVVVTSR